MPIDHKRINGPESSESYLLYSTNNNSKEVYTKLYVEGKRLDNRKSDEHRKICILLLF